MCVCVCVCVREGGMSGLDVGNNFTNKRRSTTFKRTYFTLILVRFQLGNLIIIMIINYIIIYSINDTFA